MTEKTYKALKFKQNIEGTDIIVFIAKSAEIDVWASPPTKVTPYLRGYQRGLDSDRIREISQFFENPKNTSPSSILLSLNPNCTNIDVIETNFFGEGIDLVNLKLEYEDCYDTINVDDLITKTLEILRKRLDEEDEEDEESVDDEENGECEEDEKNEINLFENFALSDEDITLKSGFETYISNLENPDFVSQLNEKDKEGLKASLKSLLLPAIIVDGQHRVGGAAEIDNPISFVCCAFVDSDIKANWEEQVFQFIILNLKARKINTEFISSIIATSLTKNELKRVSKRIDDAKVGIKSKMALIMNRIHIEEVSPFYQLIDHNIEGHTGFLGFTGMKTIVKKWYSPRQDYRELLKPLITDKWEDAWFDFFCVFWDKVKEKYTNCWGNSDSNLMKLVTLQELQNKFFSWGVLQISYRGGLIGKDELKDAIDNFLIDISEDFFTRDWIPASQSKDFREYLQRALNSALSRKAYYNTKLFMVAKD